MARRHPLLLLSAFFLVLHGILFVYDLFAPEAFLKADRAIARYEKIVVVFDPQQNINFQQLDTHPVYFDLFPDNYKNLSFPERVIEIGAPGDYFVQGTIWRMGGQHGLVAAQIALAFIALVCLWRLGVLLGLTETAAAIGGVIYAILPASLIQPHQLSSEALFNPLVVIGLYLVVRTIEQRLRAGTLVLALLLLAIAIILRLQLSLFPFVLALALWLAGPPDKMAKTLAAVVVPFSFLALWLAFIFVQTGGLSAGESNITLSRVLSIQAENTARIAGSPLDLAGDEMSFGEFLFFVADHPIAYFRFKLAEVANLLGNPGINMLFGEYLGLAAFQFGTGESRLWVSARSSEGILGIVSIMLQQNTTWLVTFVTFTLAWGVVVLICLYGTLRFIRCPAISIGTKVLLLSFVVYSIVVMQVVGLTRLGHRSSFEFIIALMAVFAFERAWRQPVDHRQRPRHGSTGTADRTADEQDRRLMKNL